MNNTTKIKLPVLPLNQPVPLYTLLALPTAPFRPADVPAFDRCAQNFEGRPLRTSNYTIYVELPGDASETLLIHGYAGAYDRASRAVVGYLRARDKPAAKPLHGNWSSEPAPADPSPVSEATIERLKKPGRPGADPERVD